MALIFSILARYAALNSMNSVRIDGAIIAAQVLARWSFLPLGYFNPSARHGLGSDFMKGLNINTVIAGTVFSGVLVILLFKFQGGLSLALACAIVIAASLYFRRMIGGITGDALEQPINSWRLQRMPFSLPEIQRPDRQTQSALQQHLDNLTKPPGSIGRLEELAKAFGTMRGSTELVLKKRAIFTFAADHGISRSGVSAYPREVTAQMVFNFVRGGAAINVLCRHYGIESVVVDVGVDHEFQNLPGLMHKKVKRGTENFLEQPAMTEEEAIRALQVGIDCGHGYDLIGTGDMGIGNTTSSAAILAVLARVPVEEAVGRGTGIDNERLQHKVNTIKEAIHAGNQIPAMLWTFLQKLEDLKSQQLRALFLAPLPGAFQSLSMGSFQQQGR